MMFFYLLLSYLSLISSQTYGNLTYNVLGIVKTIHSFPHINSKFQKISNHFNIDRNDLNNEYSQSVLTLPILFTCLLFVSFTIFELSLCCRVCCTCCRCLDSEPIRASINSMALWTEKVTKSKVSLIRSFWIFVLFSLIACQGIIFSGIYLINGFQHSIDSANNLYDLSINLEDSGYNLDTSGNIALNLVTQSIPTCPEAKFVQPYANDFNTYVTDYLNIIQPIPNDLTTMKDFLKKYGKHIASIAIWVTYAAVLTSILFIIFSYLSKNRIAVKVSIGWGTLIIHCILVFWCIFFIALVFFFFFFVFPLTHLLLVIIIILDLSFVLFCCVFYCCCIALNWIE